MIDNDQSTIIEAPEKTNDKMYQGKNVALTPLMYMLWSIILNQTCRKSYSVLLE